MKKILLALALSSSLLGCGILTQPDKSQRILEGQGYTRVEITGYRFFACDDHDTFSTGFKAISPAGHEVTGVVCAGFLKKSTIRLD